MPRIRYLLAHLLLPFSRSELPGWGRLADILVDGPSHDRLQWQGLPIQLVRGKWHGYLMPLDLANWSQRLTWFMGRFYEVDTQLIIRAFVKPGDTLIDVGANIGMITLLASRQVGPTGQVLCFEPNPSACAALRRVIQLNDIKNVEIYELALSNVSETKTLSVTLGHDGLGTLADVTGKREFEVTYPVMTMPGDSILPQTLDGDVFIKIDVEGFEPFVLEGLRDTIQKYRPIILTEFEPAHLERAGTSASALFAFADANGYSLCNIETERRRFGYKVRLRDSPNLKDMSRNVLWVPNTLRSDSRVVRLSKE